MFISQIISDGVLAAPGDCFQVVAALVSFHCLCYPLVSGYVYLRIDVGAVIAHGEERKEIWVDARDLQEEDNNGNKIPDATYRAQLAQRGREKLAPDGAYFISSESDFKLHSSALVSFHCLCYPLVSGYVYLRIDVGADLRQTQKRPRLRFQRLPRPISESTGWSCVSIICKGSVKL